MTDFWQRKDILLKAMLVRYAAPVDKTCHACQMNIGHWRCKDCAGLSFSCRGCIRKAHSDLPFHEVEIWTGNCFQPSQLWRAGCRLWIPHEDIWCEGLLDRRRQIEDWEQHLDAAEQERWKPIYSKHDTRPTPTVLTPFDMDELFDGGDVFGEDGSEDNIPGLMSVDNSDSEDDPQTAVLDEEPEVHNREASADFEFDEGNLSSIAEVRYQRIYCSQHSNNLAGYRVESRDPAGRPGRRR